MFKGAIGYLLIFFGVVSLISGVFAGEVRLWLLLLIFAGWRLTKPRKTQLGEV